MLNVYTVYCDELKRPIAADCEAAAKWKNGGSTVEIKCDNVVVSLRGITSAMLRVLAADFMAAADSTDEASGIKSSFNGIYDAIPADQ